MSAAWSWFVIALVALNIGGCVALLWYTSKRRAGQHAAEDTGHVWDGDLTEYNKPLPRWWIILFYITIVFSLAYLTWYGGWGDYAGTSGWSSRGELGKDQAEAEARMASLFAEFDQRPLAELVHDPRALELGASVFANNCATCHGSDARGAKGFPNLADGRWQWGGEPEQVLHTVLHGRTAAMPALGAALGGDQGITETAVYVQSLSGQKADPLLAARGKARFETLCAACHQADGSGNPLLGAPDLGDREWLYGGDFDSIRHSIAHGRNGQMPAHADIIGESRARLVAAWVLSLSADPQAEAAGAAAPSTGGSGGAVEAARPR